MSLAIGVLTGGAAVFAHFGGFLTPLYQLVGLHGPTAESGHQEHAGHAMPQETTSPADQSQVPGYSTVTISPQRQQLIGVRTGKVIRDELLMSIRSVGIIEPDQTRLAQFHTRISGWVTKVYANFVGQVVKKGDPLLELYSPELLAAQAEYVTALQSLEAHGDSDTLQRQLVEAARRKLELWAVPEEEIKQLQQSRRIRDTLTLRSPIDGHVLERHVLEGSYVEPSMELYRIADLSVVWLQAKIYEHELPHIEVDQPVRVSLPSQPGTVYTGKVSFVEPVLQEMTRTVKVRVAIENPNELFKPGMYADLTIEHPMGQGLLVSESAVLRSGERAIAFRTLPEGRFEPVEVKLGSRFGERFEVLGGLAEGDEIVVSGNFLIDSDSRLKSAMGAMVHGH